MKIEGRKLAIYEELTHGDSINLNDLYNKFLPCSVKTGQTHLSDDIYFIHDISNLGLAYKTLLFSITQLPILTTSSTQSLMSEYNERHHHIFQKAIHTVDLYNKFERKRYKQPMIDQPFIFVPLNGSVRKDTSFINLMYVETIHKLDKGMTTVNFYNYLGIDMDYDCKTLKTRTLSALNDYLLYFYPEAMDMLGEEMLGKGSYLVNQLKHTTFRPQSVDSEWLTICRHKVDYFLTIQQLHQTLTINEFIEEYDSYWDKI